MIRLAIHLFVLILCIALASAQVERPDDDVAPAPPSIGADVPLTYFGPAPSQVDRRLIGPVQLLKSGVINFDEGTITIPLYKGRYYDNTTHYYILTDTTDPANAAALGLNHAAKLEYITPESGATADLSPKGILVNRTGKIDFSPNRILQPGPDSAPFPPTEFGAPQVGDKLYSPYVRISNAGSRLYNAPIVADGMNSEELDEYCEGIPENSTEAYDHIHSKVVAICPSEATVTVKLTPGFSFSKPVLYLSMDASAALPAAMEDTTLAPRLATLLVGTDDSAFSPVERLFAVINGFTNRDLAPGAPQNETVHPSRQGFFSALFEEGSPLNVLGGIPTVATDYSPAWDLNVGEWTRYSVENGIRDRLIEEFQVLGFVERGYMTGPGNSTYGSSGFIVNCPIVHRFL